MTQLQHGIQAAALACSDPQPLFNPKMYISIQNRHAYTGDVNSERPGDSKNVFLQCGDV